MVCLESHMLHLYRGDGKKNRSMEEPTYIVSLPGGVEVFE